MLSEALRKPTEDQTMVPTLYHVPKTISSPIVQSLIELDVTSMVRIKTLSFKELKDPTYLRINPMGTSPTFTDNSHKLEGEVVLYESGAILSWILEEYDAKQRLHRGPGSVGRSRFLFLQQYILATIYPFVASLYIHTLKPPEEQDDGFLQNGKEKWFTLLAPNLQSLLAKNGGGTFLMGGDSPTALDFLLAKPLGNARSMNALDDFPELLALLEQVEKRPSYAHAYSIAPPPAPCKTSPVQTRSLLFVSSGEE